MNRRDIFNISAVTALALAFLTGGAAAQQRTIQQRLVGAWTIVSYEAINPDGTKQQFVNPNGFLIFDSGGRYAQVIATPDRSKDKTPGQPTTEELLTAIAGFVANAGTWSVSEAERGLTQHFDAALRPDDEGANFRSLIDLDGDELRLTSVRPLPTGARIDVVYRRVK